MNKKIFTLLLLAVFMLAQFSVVSAIAVTATTTIAVLPTFHNGAVPVPIDWAVSGMPNTGPQFVFIWMKSTPSLFANWSADPTRCGMVFNATGLTAANGTINTNLAADADDDQDVVEYLLTVDSAGTCATAALPAPATAAQASTFIDGVNVKVLQGFPPSMAVINPPVNPVVCNTFEYWALASDNRGIPVANGYSGFGGWNQSITGTFAPPAPEGPANELLSWEYAFPATASGAWTFAIAPEDVAENPSTYINTAPGPYAGNFRTALAIAPDELEDCADFSDTAGHADETYIRYLADLELISGFADGTFGPDTTLTRAEAATLFEKANGWADEVGLPAVPPSAACTFTDVTAADWFSGWVWQACDDGFMNGIGGGLFDPNNLLTRGQVVTVMNNIANTIPAWTAPFNSYLDSPSLVTDWWGNPAVMRTGAWTDVAIGAYYATPVVQAYGWGVAEGTSDTTFSPDAPATRGVFAKWLYRALSRTE